MLFRALTLTAVISFILHSDSAWAMEVKPHLQTAITTLSHDVLPQVQHIISQLL